MKGYPNGEGVGQTSFFLIIFGSPQSCLKSGRRNKLTSLDYPPSQLYIMLAISATILSIAMPRWNFPVLVCAEVSFALAWFHVVNSVLFFPVEDIGTGRLDVYIHLGVLLLMLLVVYQIALSELEASRHRAFR